MQLYDDKGAPNPRRVRVFIEEKGMDVPKTAVSIMEGQHKTPDYRKIAPNGRVPALVLDDGSVILESMSICRYLEGLQPEPNLFGKDPKEQGLIDAMSRRMEFELMGAMAAAFRHTNESMAALEKQFPDFGESQREAANRRLQIMDQDLKGKEFLVCDRFTVADITAYCILDFFPRVSQFDLGEDLANIHRWKAALKQRPSIQNSIKR